MLKKARIAILKSRLRSAYLAYMAELGRYDCGAHMAEIINPEVSRLRNRCNRLLSVLAKLDPSNCPCTRIA